MHSLSHKPIVLEDCPLGYFLVLCDEIQDWGRNRFPRTEFNRDVVAAISSPVNWQVRGVPVLSELLLNVRGFDGQDFVLETFPSRDDTRSSFGRIDLYQFYLPISEDLLEPLILWTSKAVNLERLRARSWSSAINLVILTTVPEQMRRMQVTNESLLARVAERVPHLNINRFVHLLVGMRENWIQRMESEVFSLSGPSEADSEGGADFCKTKRVGFATRLGEQIKTRTIDAVVLNLETLASRNPLRGFETETGFPVLAKTKKDLLREIEERFRFLGGRLFRHT
ncbi:MAG: hypothetical protein HQM08_29325 [Candidatus Riflebacteria bacterium]|nr:hypothetical protein [Candidatus Riflebacteria bacterium]